MRNLIATIGIVAALVVMPKLVLAITPYVCDPGTDTHGCECPTNLSAAGLDSCTETEHAELIQATDAAELANYISATKEGGIYFVDIDVESMPGAGVIRLGAGAGEWEDLDELRDFFRVLLDDNAFEFEDDSGTFNGLPRMRVVQRGATHRFNDVSGEWAWTNSNMLLIDVITTHQGVIQIGSDVPMHLTPYGDECPGYDNKSAAGGSDGALSAFQCSDAFNHYRDLNDSRCVPYGVPCGLIMWSAGTVHETASTIQFGSTLHCSNENDAWECDLMDGWFTAERKLADEISLTNDYYTDQFYDDTQMKVEEDVMELVLYDTWHNGVCSEGVSTTGVLEVDLQTRDGLYETLDEPCDF